MNYSKLLYAIQQNQIIFHEKFKGIFVLILLRSVPSNTNEQIQVLRKKDCIKQNYCRRSGR